MSRRSAASGACLMLLALAAIPATPAGAEQPEPGTRPALREGAPHAIPLYGTLLRVYDAPDDPFAPGHRGADVGADRGAAVHASAAGIVSFAGSVAGNRSVTVYHEDGIRSTYSFLETILVVSGQVLQRGDVVGTVGDGHPGAGLPPHVHLSVRREDAYFDPLTLYVGSDHSDLVSLDP